MRLPSPPVLFASCLVLAALLTASACGTSDRSEPGSDVSLVPDDTVVAFTVGTTPPTDTAPLLELVDVCYGGCATVAAGGLPSVAVYPDGTIVRHGYESADGTPQATLAGYDGRLDAATLGTLVDEARLADLALGGVGVNGTTDATTEGSGIRLVARLDGMQTAFEIPFLDLSVDPAADPTSGDGTGGDPAQRAALAAVARHLRALGTDVAVNPRRGAAWAVLAAPTSADPVATWTAVDVSAAPTLPGLVSESPALGLASGTPLRCLVLPPGDDHAGPLAAASNGWLAIRSGASTWAVAGRPLLPDEHTCAELAASVADEHAGELADLRRR